MATKRKAISKKMRFEVFKRDNFTCQYCGRSAPEVVLEPDHIVPVCKGGDNSLLNLTTSCFDCNRGKGKQLLSENQQLQKEKAQLAELNERKQQMEMLLEWKKELKKIIEKQVEAIAEVIETDDYKLTKYEKEKIADLIRRFSFLEVYEAAEIAFYKYLSKTQRLRFLGGICYNRRKAKETGVKYYGNQKSG